MKLLPGKRAYIREQNALINKSDELLEQYDKTDEALQKLENSKKDTGACFEIISERFTSCALPLPKDFAAISIKNQKELEVVTAEYSNVQQQLIQHEKKIATAKSSYEKLLKQHEKFQENFKKKSTKIENQINELLDSIKSWMPRIVILDHKGLSWKQI